MKVNVLIGLSHYTVNWETGEVLLLVPATWNDKHNRINKQKYRTIKPHTPKWYEVRQIAKSATIRLKSQ